MPTIVGVRFKPTGKTYYFDPKGIRFKSGEGAIVETSRGAEFATVVIENKEVPDSQIVGELKPVKNKATPADIERFEQNLSRKNEIMRIVREKIEAHGLDMHLKDMDFSYDNSKMTFYYAADDRVDFRELVKDLGATLRTRVELRQIGIRDETKMLGGLGSCGRPCCCSSFLNGFERVSIKMAKVQGLSLNPVNISGLCGRLMCCLKYENEHYLETSKLMPKVNDVIATPDGEGKVESVDLLRRNVKVQFSDENGAVVQKVFNITELNLGEKQVEDFDDDDTVIGESLFDEDVQDLTEQEPYAQDKPQEKTQDKPRDKEKHQDKKHRQNSRKEHRQSNKEQKQTDAGDASAGSDTPDANGEGAKREHKQKDRPRKERKQLPLKHTEQTSVDAEAVQEEGAADKASFKPHKRHKKHKNFNKNKQGEGNSTQPQTKSE